MGMVCDHCLTEISEANAIFEVIDGVKKAFCCNGCQGIFHILRNSGLDGFYKKRSEWLPGPPEKTAVSSDTFKDSVLVVDGELQIDLALSGIRCASCIWLIEHFLMKSLGINSARVNYATHRARIRWNPLKMDLATILNSIASIGYTPLPYSSSSYDELKKKEKKDLIIRLGAASLLSMQIMMLTAGLYAGYFQGIAPDSKKTLQIITWLLATPVIFYSGYPFIKNTLIGLRNRMVNMDTLVFLGSFSAYAYSMIMIPMNGEVYFDTSSMIITLILLGRVIETEMKGKASEAISLLMRLQPKLARKVRGIEREDVPISSIKKGDVIEVIPGEVIPLDCEVVEGESEVDESMLTGESVPVNKKEGSEVFAGTMNLNGSLILTVKKGGDETLLANIIRTVEDANSRKASIEQIADRVVGWFVPTILFISILTFLFWHGKGAGIANSLMTSVSVLVISCPCALGLATALAILTASSELMKKGVLVRGGALFETVAETDMVVFDKTGTLTSGRPSDTLRPEAVKAVKDLKRLGCNVKVLTGDKRPAAERIAEQAGIPKADVVPEISPVQKAEKVAELKIAGYKVLMVGDGINDAPALTEADAGVAMGKGTDIAMKSAGIVLMRNDLALIPSLIKVSRKTLSIIRQNLFWAFSYNLIAIPLAVTGNIHPIISAAFMAVSSLVVTGNSLRLKDIHFTFLDTP